VAVLGSATPAADETSDRAVTWNDIGPIAPGQSKDLSIKVTVPPGSAGGQFTDTAVATALCGPSAADAGAGATAGASGGKGTSAPLEAKATLDKPGVLMLARAAELPAQLPSLPRTGAAPLAVAALGLGGAGLGVALRGLGRRRRS
jgi:hypothetical protein